VRVLLVRLRPIGDVVFTTPLLGALRRHLPEAHVTYVVEPDAAPILERNSDIDALTVVPRSHGLARVREDLAIAIGLVREGFDIAIDLHGGPRSAWFTWASRAQMRIGYTISGRTWMYTHAVPRARQLTPRHSVENQFDLLAPLGVPMGTPSRDPVNMNLDTDADERVSRRLARVGVGPEHVLIVIHVSASNRFKRWPEGSFTSLVVDLVGRAPSSRRVVLISGPSDIGAARRIAQEARGRLGQHAESVLDVGEFELPELQALFSRATAYVGGDSGPVHIAATTRVPIVELLGPTLPERSHPWRDPRWFSEIVDAGPLPCRPCHQRTCAPGDFRCLTSIDPKRVLAAVERALQSAPGPIGPPGPLERRIPVGHA